MNINFEFVQAKKFRPAKSCQCLCVFIFNNEAAYYHMPYSRKHDKFNVTDDATSCISATEPDFWAYEEETGKALVEGFNNV